MLFFKAKTIQQIQESAVAQINSVIKKQHNEKTKATRARKKAEAREQAAELEITKGQNYIQNYNKMFEIPSDGCDSEEHS